MIVPMPSVAITELTRILVTMRPLSRPISAPTPITTTIATGIGRPLWTMRPVTSTPSRLAAKPIDRSSSPTMTAMVSPPAMIMASDAWLRTLTTFDTVGKATGERIAKIAIITRRPMMVP